MLDCSNTKLKKSVVVDTCKPYVSVCGIFAQLNVGGNATSMELLVGLTNIGVSGDVPIVVKLHTSDQDDIEK